VSPQEAGQQFFEYLAYIFNYSAEDKSALINLLPPIDMENASEDALDDDDHAFSFLSYGCYGDERKIVCEKVAKAIEQREIDEEFEQIIEKAIRHRWSDDNLISVRKFVNGEITGTGGNGWKYELWWNNVDKYDEITANLTWSPPTYSLPNNLTYSDKQSYKQSCEDAIKKIESKIEEINEKAKNKINKKLAEEINTFVNEQIEKLISKLIDSTITTYKKLVREGYEYVNKHNDAHKDKAIKQIMICNDNLSSGEYAATYKDKQLYGFFSKEDQFAGLMQSGGGSTLIIYERDNLPSHIKHFGGKYGRFNYGLYCEHPKDKNTLIPLTNYNEIIKNMILEETIRIYEALGAKEILIEDITKIDAGVGAGCKEVNVGANASYGCEKLREKTFGKGAFDPDRAFQTLCFAPDLPHIMTVAEARVHGNQLSEEFTEIVNLNVGLDIDIFKLFKAQANFKYDRTWHFKVEFYDKGNL
jgi:hypothetical protein